jgi:hypothetical protein
MIRSCEVLNHGPRRTEPSDTAPLVASVAMCAAPEI